MDSMEDLCRVIDDFYWPRLEILWNPPSRLHWIRALSVLQHSGISQASYPLPPNLLLTAARYGLARLNGRNALAELALGGLFHPASPSDWRLIENESKEVQEEMLEFEKKRCKEESGISWWQPFGYQEASSTKVAAWSSSKKAKARNCSKYRNSEMNLLKEENSALNYLKSLHKQFLSQAHIKQLLRIEQLEIHLLDISLKKIDSCDRNALFAWNLWSKPILSSSASRKQPIRRRL